jgi:cyclic lactone autoinducer peptide
MKGGEIVLKKIVVNGVVALISGFKTYDMKVSCWWWFNQPKLPRLMIKQKKV